MYVVVDWIVGLVVGVVVLFVVVAIIVVVVVVVLKRRRSRSARFYTTLLLTNFPLCLINFRLLVSLFRIDKSRKKQYHFLK